LIKTLIDKGFAYETPEAVYYDVTKFKDYAKFFGQKLVDKKVASRSEVQTGKHKKHSVDFALWFKRVGHFSDHSMHWESPWGDGFPGWHIECSAMSMHYLGNTIDIHTGGPDHLPIHHPNEIAQSEAATGKQFVRYWMHHAFLMVDGQKMSKSLGNFYRVSDVEEKGFDPLDLRYFYLTAHYRSQQNFTWEALRAAQSARKRLKAIVQLARQSRRIQLSHEKFDKTQQYLKKFFDAVLNDLNFPEALAVVWDAVKSNIPSEDKYDLLMSFDELLGLKLADSKQQAETNIIPKEIQKLVDEREQLRKEMNFAQADKVRKQIEEKGFLVEDTPNGPQVNKNTSSS
jgi:cysteinyl-tRNA synthetase